MSTTCYISPRKFIANYFSPCEFVAFQISMCKFVACYVSPCVFVVISPCMFVVIYPMCVCSYTHHVFVDDIWPWVPVNVTRYSFIYPCIFEAGNISPCYVSGFLYLRLCLYSMLYLHLYLCSSAKKKRKPLQQKASPDLNRSISGTCQCLLQSLLCQCSLYAICVVSVRNIQFCVVYMW